MAIEGIAITPGTGRTVATDTVGGFDYQLVKIYHGLEDAVPTAVSATAPLPVVNVVAATGGASTFHLVLAAGTNATRLKATAGTVFSIDVVNDSSSMFYVKFHNSAASPPTAGSGVVRAFGVQAGVPRSIAFGDLGLAFSTGIGISVTTSITDAGVVPVTLNAGIIDIAWI